MQRRWSCRLVHRLWGLLGIAREKEVTIRCSQSQGSAGGRHHQSTWETPRRQPAFVSLIKWSGLEERVEPGEYGCQCKSEWHIWIQYVESNKEETHFGKKMVLNVGISGQCFASKVACC